MSTKTKSEKLPKCRHYTVLFLKYIDEWISEVYIYKWIENVWQETQAIHMGIHPGSYVEVNIPWMTGPEGYTTTVHGQLLLVDATTSLQYRSLVECETFEVRTKTDTAVHFICTVCFMNLHVCWIFLTVYSESLLSSDLEQPSGLDLWFHCL